MALSFLFLIFGKRWILPIDSWLRYISSNIYNYGTSGWKDVLTSYNGTSLTHDAIGNLTNDGTWTYTWQAGRQLKQMSKSGTTIQYQYDHNGLRVGKVVTTGGVATTTEYTLYGNLVTGMKQGSNTLHFFYDAQSRPAMVEFNGVIYTYAHNYQGDIIAILDSTGAIVVEYYYDAWGRQYSVTGSMKDTLGKLNPFRYRGYVYDEETSLYYLRSRYYNPLWGRFINSDTVLGEVGAVGSHNLFAYCGNNPVVMADPDGCTSVAAGATGYPPIDVALVFLTWILGEIFSPAIPAPPKAKTTSKPTATPSASPSPSPKPTLAPTATPKIGPYYFIAIAYEGGGPRIVSEALTGQEAYETLHIVNAAAFVEKLVANSPYSNISDYVYGVYTYSSADAANLAKRFGDPNPRLDLPDGGMYGHYNVTTPMYKNIHFWYSY